MKKIMNACLAALMITLAGMYINYRTYTETGHLKLAYRMYGGEITAEYGFGLFARHIYAMTQGTPDTHSFGFSPVCFALTFLGLTVLILLILKGWESIITAVTGRR